MKPRMIDFVRNRLRECPSIPKLAPQVGLTEKTLYNILSGLHDPGYSKVEKLYLHFQKRR
jgi:hypothetical protein